MLNFGFLVELDAALVVLVFFFGYDGMLLLRGFAESRCGSEVRLWRSRRSEVRLWRSRRCQLRLYRGGLGLRVAALA